MQVKRVFGGMALVALVGLAGCHWPAEPTVYTESDNGRTVALPVGETFQVQLASNPSTGYAWQIIALDTTIVANTGHSFVPPAVPLDGAGGTDHWDFVTQAAGTTVLVLGYFPPGQTDGTPATTFELTINVGSSGELVFTVRDNGRVVSLPVGTHFIVRLASTPSTGYAWQISALGTSVLVTTGHAYVPPPVAFPGNPGYEDWDFFVQTTGTAALQLQYVLSDGSGGTPGQVFTLTVQTPLTGT